MVNFDWFFKHSRKLKFLKNQSNKKQFIMKNTILFIATVITLFFSSCSKEDMDLGCNTCPNGGNGVYGIQVVQVITPNSTQGNLVVGQSYWGFTSAPADITSGAGLGSYHGPVICTPIRITVTGYNADGAYTYTADPFTMPEQVTFIASTDDLTKSEITTSIADQGWVIIVLGNHLTLQW